MSDKLAIGIDTDRYFELSRGMGTYSTVLAMDIVMALWAPAQQPVTSDPEELAQMLNAVFPKKDYSPELIRQLLPGAMNMLVLTPSGKLVPSPDVFVLASPEAN